MTRKDLQLSREGNNCLVMPDTHPSCLLVHLTNDSTTASQSELAFRPRKHLPKGWKHAVQLSVEKCFLIASAGDVYLTVTCTRALFRNPFKRSDFERILGPLSRSDSSPLNSHPKQRADQKHILCGHGALLLPPAPVLWQKTSDQDSIAEYPPSKL